MAREAAPDIDTYIAEQPELNREPLRRIRAALRAGLPEAVEDIRYQIPTLRMGGKNVLHFAGFKGHCGVYPASAAALEAYPELATRLHGKATLRFELDEAIPEALLGDFARFRAAELGKR